MTFVGLACTDACRGYRRCISTAGENAEKCQDMPTPTNALAQHADAPLLCWEARASLMVVVLTVVERMMADEGEVPIVELRHIVKSFLHNIVLWSSNKGKNNKIVHERRCDLCVYTACGARWLSCAIVERLSPRLIQLRHVDRKHSDPKLLAFGIGALSHLVLPLRERHEEFRVRGTACYALMLIGVALCSPQAD